MTIPDAAIRVDVRGLLGPWPALRLERAIRLLGGPGRIRLLADDPVASAALETLCGERGWTVDRRDPKEIAFDVRIG